MKSYGRTSVSEFLGDRIVYRNLDPYDRSLPRMAQIRQQVGLPAGSTPRKNEPEYARVIVYLLQQCLQQDRPGGKIERLVFVGDTRLLDGTAYANLCQAGGWPGLAFIGSEDQQPAGFKLSEAEGSHPAGHPAGFPLYLSNRWTGVRDFDRYCTAQNLPVGLGTAVVIDLDKTTVGARGRNSQVIDQARLEAVETTVADLLGAAFDPVAFRAVYDPLNQPEFHSFTADNQDYLAYICLILGSGLYSYTGLIDEVKSGRLASFGQFISAVEHRMGELPSQLAQIHRDIYRNFQAGDPTPFKTFRRNEYFSTTRRFGCLDDSAPVEKLLQAEIVITQEVRQMALEWRSRGALLFGLSDKPDEASLPTPELEQQGHLPLHRTVTHVVGE
jgi:hypothetical protein